MCQAVIATLVQFRDEKDKQVRVLLTGIGSHSEMISDNEPKLRHRGYIRGHYSEERVYSIESQLQKGWAKFSYESPTAYGVPSDIKKMFQKTVREIAGNAKRLREFVHRIGKVDNALVRLLRPPIAEQFRLDSDFHENIVYSRSWKKFPGYGTKPTRKRWEYVERSMRRWRVREWDKLFRYRANRISILR